MKRNREQLKSFFRKGTAPKQEHFEDLIDSMLNLVDDEELLTREQPEAAEEEHPATEVPVEDNTIETAVAADGEWHSLPVEDAVPDNPAGCRVYEIFASYKDRKRGRYVLCEVRASHSNGDGCEMRSPQKHWWGWSGELKFRWERKDGDLLLQVRSKGWKKGAEHICCRIVKVWEYTGSV